MARRQTHPCKCGFFQSGVRDCRCDEGSIANDNAKLSGPLLDRVDLHVAVQPVPWRELNSADRPVGDSSAVVRDRVILAREIQTRRLSGLTRADQTPYTTNASIPVDRLDALIRPTPDARQLLGRAVERLGLSARAAHRSLRVARTIADLAGEERIRAEAMAEAVGLRSG